MDPAKCYFTGLHWDIAGHYWELFEFWEDALLWSMCVRQIRSCSCSRMPKHASAFLCRLGLGLQFESLLWNLCGTHMAHSTPSGDMSGGKAWWEVGKVGQTVGSREQV